MDDLIAWLKERGIGVVIPPKANRREPRKCDWWLYKERHGVECMFGKIKHYRRAFSRYEKPAIYVVTSCDPSLILFKLCCQK